MSPCEGRPTRTGRLSLQGRPQSMPPAGLEDIAREAIVLPMASKSTQPTLEVADSESDDKPRPLQGGLALQVPQGPPSVPRTCSFLPTLCIMLEARPALPLHTGKIGKVPGLLLPCLSQRLQSGPGHVAWQGLIPYPHWPQRLESLSRPLRTFSLPQPSLALIQHFAALRQGQPLHQLQGHISCSLHRRKQPSALEDSAAYQHGQVCCKPWVPQASSGHKFSKRSMWQTTWPPQSGSTPWGPWKPTSRSALGSWTSAFAQAFRWEHSPWLPWRITYESHKQDRSSCKLAPKQALKALSWLARIAELPCLKDLLGSPLISAFRTDSEFKDRKEALPLPLAALCACYAVGTAAGRPPPGSPRKP